MLTGFMQEEGKDEILPQEVVDLFSTDKPVFIQAAVIFPGEKYF